MERRVRLTASDVRDFNALVPQTAKQGFYMRQLMCWHLFGQKPGCDCATEFRNLVAAPDVRLHVSHFYRFLLLSKET